jgi:predicted Rossmann-fold nucleotide-binding protein
VKEKFLEYWDKEIKRLDQKIDEGFISENKVNLSIEIRSCKKWKGSLQQQ